MTLAAVDIAPVTAAPTRIQVTGRRRHRRRGGAKLGKRPMPESIYYPV